MDVSKKYLKDAEAFYLLNFDVLNPSFLGKGVPFAANSQMCEFEMPLGETFTIGSYPSPLTNETYDFKYNSNGIHFISRINSEGICQIVYYGPYLKLSADPKHSIEKWRVYLHIEKSDCANRAGKYLIWTDGLNPIGWIDVEASIATNNFTTPFFHDCISGSEPVQLCTPKPCECLTAEYVPLPEDETSITNTVVDSGFKFIARGLYYDNQRATEWTDPSTLYYQNAESCFYDTKGSSRCIKLRVPAFNPLVDKIEIGFSKGDINTNGDGIWYLTDTIEKYKKYNSSEQQWYEREISESLLNYSDCHFDYNFCNDKQCQAIDISEITRVFNPIPRQPQGIVPIDKGLGFYNYIQGNCPVDKNETDKFHITQNCPEDTTCVPEMVSIKVRAIIHSTLTNINQFIWRNKGAILDEDDVTDPANFGGLQDLPSIPNPVINSGHEQTFSGTIRDFKVYVEGTDYFGIFKQYISESVFTGKGNELVNVLAGAVADTANFIAARKDVRAEGSFYFQEATILVPKGMKGFLRIDSHKEASYNPNTSTQVIGTIDDITGYVPDSGLVNFNKFRFEIPFECGETDIPETFIIDDMQLAHYSGVGSSVSNTGYIKDDIGRPLEGLEIWATREGLGGPDDTNHVFARTDHNGFYFLYNQVGRIKNSTAGIFGELDCATWSQIQPIGLNRTTFGGNVPADAKILNQIYLNDFYTTISAPVKDCNGNLIEGIKVALSGSKSQITKSNGIAQFRIRNYKSRDRVVTAIAMSKFGCYTVACNGSCNPCFPSSTSSTDACYSGKPVIPVPTMILSIQAALKHLVGLKSGGLYPFGVVIEFGCGDKISAVYELPQIQIDSTQKKNKLSFCGFNFDATGITLPQDATCLKIVRGTNLNAYTLQWVVDKIEKTADQKLKLTIQSLNDYNFKYFEKTNTLYQYIKGDRVEFIRNGDGKIFDTTTFGLLNYQILSPFLDTNQVPTGITTTADYFNQILIDDDGKLNGLVAGAVIELQRETICTTEPTYFSICASIPVINGKLVSETGMFTTFDTYLVQRQIGNFSVQSFEHKTPSDFWGGNGIDDTGKPYFKNKYENEKRFGRNLSISDPNQLNRFGDIVKTFDAPEQGDITAMQLYDGKIGIAVGEHDNFLFSVSDDLLRVGSDGSIHASRPDDVVSRPEAKVRGQYGCRYEDIGSVQFFDGGATWIDSDRFAHVKHNFSIPRDISEEKMQSFFRKIIQAKNIANKTAANDLDKVRFINGWNKVSRTSILTTKALRHSDINNEISPYTLPNTTLIFNPYDEQGTYLTFASFTPDCYSNINIDQGSAFVSYYKGVPYLHSITSDTWNTFYGASCDQFIGIAFNKFPEKLKNFIALEGQSDMLFFIKEILTDNPSFLSETPIIKVKSIGNKKWNMPLMGNKNSVEGLFGNKTPSGYFVSVLLARDNTINFLYNSVNEEKRKQFSQIDLILNKYSLLEQSGLENNL